MKSFLYKHGLPIVYLLFLSLIPLLWYQSGTIGLGHDMGWSLVPVDRFLDRLFAWTKSGLGSDQSLELGAITVYAVPAFFSLLHIPIIAVQKFTYIFWFFSMSLSMYYFSQSIYKGKHSRFIALIAVTFYTLNHYTLQAWSVAELSKFSAMVIFPIFFANVWKVIHKEADLIKTAIITSFFFFFFNGGGGSGIPLYGGMIISLLFLLIYSWLVEKQSLLRLLKIYFVFVITAILTNLYWIIPLLDVIRSQYSPFVQTGGPAAAVAWTDVISKNTSLINLFRLQGFSSWYDTTNHPYAGYFLSNPLFILSSFLFPVFVFLSYIFADDGKEKRLILFFSLLALLAMIFVGGTHAPFGFLYAFLMTHMYGFAIFRTAFYKFGYALWFAYAFLFAFSSISIFIYFKKEFIVKIGFIITILFLFIYNFPFFTASFFGFDKPFETMLQLPSYILNAKDYMATFSEDDRTLLIPPPSPTNGESDVYNFGYFSRTPLPFELTQKSIATNVEVNSSGEESLTEGLYAAILQNDKEKVKSLITALGIHHILIRNDVLANNTQYRVIEPEKFLKNLLSYPWIVSDKNFGKWSFYKITNGANLFSATSPDISFVPGGRTINTDSISSGQIPIPDSFRDTLGNIGTNTVVAKCESCLDPNVNVFPHASRVVFLPTSPFYFLIQLEEQKNLKNSRNDPFFHFGFDLFYAERHAMSLRQLADQDVKKDVSSLDQYQRYTILQSYLHLVEDSYATWKTLPGIQKLQGVNELETSLEAQRNLIRPLVTSNFITDNDDTFYKIYNILNIFLSDSDVQKEIVYKRDHLVYSVSIPAAGAYSLSANGIDLSNITIDRQKVSLSTFDFTEGSHAIDVKSQSPVVLSLSNFTVQGREKKTINLPDLKKSQQYEISFDYKNNLSPALTLQVFDDFNNVKLFQVITPNSSTFTPEVHSYFTTNSAINGQYKIELLAEKEGGIEQSIDVRNFSIQEISYPQFTFSQVAATQRKQTQVPTLSIVYDNPTKYTVRVSNATDAYILLFRQTFSPLWTAKMDNGDMLVKHFSAYDSFNGWSIDKKGTYVITITFGVQKFYVIAMIATMLSIVALTAIFFWKKTYDKTDN